MSDSDWTELEPPAKASTAKAPVRFGLQKLGHGGTGRARGYVLLSRAVIEQLGLKHFRVAVRVGKGARSHQVAIVPTDDGPFELQELGTAKGGGTYRVRFPVVEQFPDASAPAFERSFKIEREGKRQMIVIDLPAYCFDANARRAFEASR